MINKITQQARAVREEALRCLYCADAPCSAGCPAGVDAGQFIRHLRCEDLKSAKRVIKEANPLGGICGYLCPSETLCQSKCTRGVKGEAVKIRELQRYVCDNAEYARPAARACGKRAAVVGAGPAGLACAAKLSERGVEVHLYDAQAGPGGLIRSEIPGSRVEEAAVARDLAELKSPLLHCRFGEAIDAAGLRALASDYDAVFLSTGLSRDRKSGAQGGGPGVMTASAFLSGVKGGTIAGVSGSVYVIGGGDAAVDAAETALRLGADRAVLTYRRSRREMPATDEVLLDAVAAGVEILYLTSLDRVEGADGRLRLRFSQNRLREIPGESRRGFEPVPGSEYELVGDMVIFALGKTADDALARACAEGGLDALDAESLRLGRGNVFAGGDLISGGATVAEAVGQGKAAAASILSALGV